MAKTNPEAPMIKQGKWKYTMAHDENQQGLLCNAPAFHVFVHYLHGSACRNVAANGLYKL